MITQSCGAGCVSMLEKLPGVKAVSETGSCLGALEQIAAAVPDLVILDGGKMRSRPRVTRQSHLFPNLKNDCSSWSS